MELVRRAASAGSRPICVTIAALGGQGGGVVCDWLVQVAGIERHIVQATSVPGVAQRTGATIYYLEFFSRASLPADGREPVMALMPSPGDVDLVLAAELLEAGRSVTRGLVTPDRTTLITSTHRDYAISEKASRHDARVDEAVLRADVAAQARRLLTLDMRAIAEQTGGHLSAVMLGAIAASSVLPFARDSYTTVISASGFDVARSLAAFEAAFSAVAVPAVAVPAVGTDSVAAIAPAAGDALPPLPSALAQRLSNEIPPPERAVVELAIRRLLDYQDQRYADLYLDRLALLPVGNGNAALRLNYARALAVWMSFEDVIRVADLKTRLRRIERVTREIKPAPGELIDIAEYVKPRVDEILGTLPARVALVLGKSPRIRGWLARLTGGRRISTTTVTGFVFLRCIALLRPWRRGTLRFRAEDQSIRAWIKQLQSAAQQDDTLAHELIACQQLVRGYGDTRERGSAAFEDIMRVAAKPGGSSARAAQIRAMRAAALADDVAA